MVVQLSDKGRLSAFCGILAVLMLFSGGAEAAQSKAELEKKKNQLHQDIEYTNQLLDQTKKNKNASLNQLVNLNKKINYRTELIQTINKEITLVDSDLGVVSNNIDSLNQRLDRLKAEYAEMMY